MKKMVILFILILAGYIGYMYFVKGVNVIDKNYKKLTGKKEAVKDTGTKGTQAANTLIFSIELGKHVTIKSAKIPEGDIRLLGVDEAKQSCLISIYKSQGTVTKGMDLRKIINNKWTVEVKLLVVKATSAILAISPISNPEDPLMIANSKNGTSPAGASEKNECIVAVKTGGKVSLKCKTLSYGSIGIDKIDYSKDKCFISIYNAKGQVSRNVDLIKHIGTQTVMVRIVSLQRNGATFAVSMPGYSDKFEITK